MRRLLIVLLPLCLLRAVHIDDTTREIDPPPLSPAKSLKALKPRPGFVAELMAAEPLVMDPIAFAWGPDGKFWVVEMGDYPLGVDGKGKPGGKVKFLEDTKGTGKYDKATVFLDNLGYPTGVLPWGKGVLVTCAPDIFYAEDTDGDGKADKKVVLFTGFGEGNQQHRVNSLVLGLDNWVYCANGDSGGKIKSLKTGQTIDIRGRDFRIKPDEGLVDAQSGQTQYGRSRDDWGNWFGNNNSNPMYHFALEDHYLRRNPHLTAPDPRVHISVKPGAAPVFPISKTLPRFNNPHSVNHFTSACSAIVYRDELFGPAYVNNTFVSEPVHNLVHREIMTPKGFTFTSRRADDERQSEFLASTDNWFRPTTNQTGPDGALWVADMYRHVIEHPQWIPLDWQKKLDLRAGHDLGRVYRVFPQGKKPRAIPRLDQLKITELVAALDSPSGWQRDLVQQMLVARLKFPSDGEEPARGAVLAKGALAKLAQASDRPLTRLHAICTLDGMGALTPEHLRLALRDKHPGVRRHAIRLCEPFLAKHPELGNDFDRLTKDSHGQVRMQLAYTLGEWQEPQAGNLLSQLAMQDGNDPYFQAALLSSVNAKNLDGLVQGLMKAAATEKRPPPGVIVKLIRMAEVLGDAPSLAKMLLALSFSGPGWRAALVELLDSLDAQQSSLTKLAGAKDANVRNAVKRLDAVIAAARRTLADPENSLAIRVEATRLLGRGLDHRAEDIKTLTALLVPQTPDDLQAAAIASLGKLRDPGIPAAILRPWKRYGPAQRSQALDALLVRPDGLRATLDAIEGRAVLPFEIDAARRQRLLEHKQKEVRERSAKLFAGAVNPDRRRLVESYRPALKLETDVMRGAKVFTRLCAGCHRLGGIGQEVGPDLASVPDKSGEALLIAILDPNQAVEARYIGYLATTKAGLSFTGLLASETSTSVTLVGADGKKQVILRTDLEELVSTGKSAMPEGLEKDLLQQELADLIGFIRGNVPLPQGRKDP